MNRVQSLGAKTQACTILLPTHNRSALLRQQIAYLSQGSLPGPVIVLDSSEELTAHKNAILTAKQSNMSYVSYPVATPVFTKISQGLKAVQTPYCMLLPDDDFVWLKALPRLIDTLERDSETVVAHGLYFEFHKQGKSVHVTELIQSGVNLDEPDALQRILSLMSGYEALTYALYRTAVAQEAFSIASKQDGILFQELLTGTIAAARGKIRRLPFISHGRRAGSSLGYRRWHPLEWYAVDPHDFFASYLPYRCALVEIVRQVNKIDIRAIERKIDLAHLAYLQTYLDKDVLLTAAKRDLEKDGEVAIAEAAWDVWASSRGPAWANFIRQGYGLTRWIRRQIRARELRYSLIASRTRGSKIVKICTEGNDSTIKQVYYHDKFATEINKSNNVECFLDDQKSLSHDLSTREAEYE